MDLKIDPKRLLLNETAFARPEQETGIYVRAQSPDGDFRSVDIVALDRVSLIRWLRSRGGSNLWAENVVLILLGHDHEEADPVVVLKEEP